MKPGLDSIRLAAPGWEFRPQPSDTGPRVWTTEKGDGVGAYFFGRPPDLPPNAACVCDVLKGYQKGLKGAGGEDVEIAIVPISGCRGVRFIFKIPQQPHGRTYVGSLTIPFRDFSFVIKAQCEEIGVTGGREAALMEVRMKKTGLSPEEIWKKDWYPDDPQYDSAFPDHPVSRCREILSGVVARARIDPSVAALPGFGLPSGTCRHGVPRTQR